MRGAGLEADGHRGMVERGDEMGSDDDDQFGFLALIADGAEESADDGQIAQEGDDILGGGDVVVQSGAGSLGERLCLARRRHRATI